MSDIQSLIKDIAKKLEEKANNLENEDKSETINITDENIEDIISKNKIVVIDFWAQWCAPCHLYEPIFERVAKKYKDKAVFGRLNVDENSKTADKYNILNIPTTLIFVNGELKETLVGAVDIDTLEQTLGKYL
ncbi:thioredoxin [Acidianus sulfidivorans JP7]|uniref:Thioredoxin n=1 Tax=Acidianus sulfidivorans JP7 TaxID=619593 RepID=A0A2U9INV2_9CREN|nr:thioredoxin [Acidianus sulfidivorans]AWR97692.1 thioredoxin [Acidianus sulfidivorans JP7]